MLTLSFIAYGLFLLSWTASMLFVMWWRQRPLPQPALKPAYIKK